MVHENICFLILLPPLSNFKLFDFGNWICEKNARLLLIWKNQKIWLFITYYYLLLKSSIFFILYHFFLLIINVWFLNWFNLCFWLAVKFFQILISCVTLFLNVLQILILIKLYYCRCIVLWSFMFSSSHSFSFLISTFCILTRKILV